MADIHAVHQLRAGRGARFLTPPAGRGPEIRCYLRDPAESVSDGPAEGPPNGYSILQAPDLDSAVALVKGHPFVGRGGSLQVSTATLPG